MNEDRFADFLDALVRGNAPANASPPADIARRLQETASDRLDRDHRAAIWKSLMNDHASTTSTGGGPGPLAQPALSASDAFNPWARRHVPAFPKRTRMGIVHEAMQTGITAMAIVAVVIAAFVAFPILRGDEATPRVTPTAWAAVPTTVAGGVAESGTTTPVIVLGKEDTSWLTYVRPEECRITPLDNDVYATVVASSHDIAGRQYGPVTSPSPDNARDVAESAREVQACERYGTPRQRQALETTRHLSREQNDLESSLDELPFTREGVAQGKMISAQYPFQDPIDFIHVFYNDPPGPAPLASDHTPFHIFQPDHAIVFGDGRIAIPQEPAYWSGQPDAPSIQTAARLPWVSMSLLVFSNEESGWRLDEILPFCVGDCDAYWDLWAPQDTGAPESNPTPDLPQPTMEIIRPLDEDEADTPTSVPGGDDTRNTSDVEGIPTVDPITVVTPTPTSPTGAPDSGDG